MVSDYVITQLDCEGKRRAPDSISLGSFGMEPVVMSLSQSAAIAAGIAMDSGVAVQDVP